MKLYKIQHNGVFRLDTGGWVPESEDADTWYANQNSKLRLMGREWRDRRRKRQITYWLYREPIFFEDMASIKKTVERLDLQVSGLENRVWELEDGD